MPFTIIRGDLAAFRADALVNAANSRLQRGGGVCGALFEAAGPQRMQEACDAIAYCAPGQAVATPAFDLPARYVIHAVGPIYRDGRQGEEDILRAAYTNSLKLAQALKLSSIAFPLISSGFSYRGGASVAKQHPPSGQREEAGCLFGVVPQGRPAHR